MCFFRRMRLASSGAYLGFTLIELLAVVAIIGILAASLFPSFQRMQERGRDVKCNSNLRQLGIAVTAYSTENNGELPSNKTTIWYVDLWKYIYPDRVPSPINSTPGVFPQSWVGTVFECPNTVRMDPKTGALRSYGFNLRAGDNSTSTPDPAASIRNPSKVAMIGENRGSNDLGRTTITARHNDLCNVVYLDGHVGSVELTNTLTKDYRDQFWGQTQFADLW